MGWNLAEIKDDALRRQLRAGLETGLARPCSELQKQEALRAERVCLHGAKGEGANEGHHRRIPRTVKLTFYISDRRHRDVDGMTSTIMDCLVRAGAIPDDNRFEIGRIEAEAVDCERGQERVEVEVEVEVEPG